MLSYLAHLIVVWAGICLLGLGLTLTLGRLGLFNISHLISAGVGAYASALLTMKVGWPPFFAVGIAGIAGSIIACLLTIAANRCKPDAFALASLSMAAAFVGIVRNTEELTGGARGLVAVPPLSIGGWVASQPTDVALLSTVLLASGYVLVSCLVRSRYGQILIAIRDDELAVSVRGITTWPFKLSALLIGGFLAGVAGAVIAHYLGVAQPDQFGVDAAFALIAVVVLGGAESPVGVLLASAFFILLPELLRLAPLEANEVAAARQVAFMCILLFVLVLSPRGLIFDRKDR